MPSRTWPRWERRPERGRRGRPGQGRHSRHRQWSCRRARRRAEAAAGRRHPRRPRPHRHEARLRHLAMRHVHGPSRWPRREVVHGPRRPGGRFVRADRGGSRSRPRESPSAAGRVRGAPRTPVRLLHTRDAHDGAGSSRSRAGSLRRRDSRRAPGQLLPMHGLSVDRELDPRGRGSHARGARDDVVAGFLIRALRQLNRISLPREPTQSPGRRPGLRDFGTRGRVHVCRGWSAVTRSGA